MIATVVVAEMEVVDCGSGSGGDDTVEVGVT